jgi:transcriptional regulator with XRE-family HTH domain
MTTSQLVARPHLAAAVGRETTELSLAVLELRARGIFAIDLARAAGMTGPVLSRLVHGHQRPSVEQAKRLAELLERPVGELFPNLAPVNGDGPVRETEPKRETSPGLDPRHDPV